MFAWARNLNVLRARPELKMLISTQPGLRTSIGAAMKAKRAGMPRGFPDIELLVMRGQGLIMEPKYGLFIELKRLYGGTLSDEQADWIQALRNEGYAACYRAGSKAAIDTIEQYLNGEFEG